MHKLGLAVIAAFTVVATPAAAVSFASFSAASAPNIEYIGNNSGGSINGLSAPVIFSFLDTTGTGTGFQSFNNVNFAFTAATGAVTSDGDNVFVPLTGGAISFTTNSAVTYGGVTGRNLLTVSFSGRSLIGEEGGVTAGYSVTDGLRGRVVTFTSDFLDFTNSTDRNLALAIDSIAPALDSGNLDFFQGTVNGGFGADGFSSNPNPTVPEPATWGLMVLGFGLAGTALRSRRNQVRAVAA